ncbi:unnamed protein product [Hydatigera taeniaeformis]|uniref:Uncharacterized protein n=1 Tax=Hydatigena taeniaeformis TaxID=6205 RepID=A0A0R3X9Q5_HYDTA|nr:unnamed protein product [Hydatigera taeniaeformis]
MQEECPSMTHLSPSPSMQHEQRDDVAIAASSRTASRFFPSLVSGDNHLPSWHKPRVVGRSVWLETGVALVRHPSQCRQMHNFPHLPASQAGLRSEWRTIFRVLQHSSLSLAACSHRCRRACIITDAQSVGVLLGGIVLVKRSGSRYTQRVQFMSEVGGPTEAQSIAFMRMGSLGQCSPVLHTTVDNTPGLCLPHQPAKWHEKDPLAWSGAEPVRAIVSVTEAHPGLKRNPQPTAQGISWPQFHHTPKRARRHIAVGAHASRPDNHMPLHHSPTWTERHMDACLARRWRTAMPNLVTLASMPSGTSGVLVNVRIPPYDSRLHRILLLCRCTMRCRAPTDGRIDTKQCALDLG